MRHMRLQLVVLTACAIGLNACGGAQKSTRTTGTKIEEKPDEEDLTTIRIVEAKAELEYVDGLSHEAQDHFREGVQKAHSVPPDYSGAADAFEAAIDEEKDFMEAYFNLAMVHERRRRPDKALAVYQRALKENPDDPSAKAFIGKIHVANARDLMAQGNIQGAKALMAQGKALFDEVLARDYENVPANNALALYWLLQDDTDQAEEYVRQVLTIQPSNVTALNTRGLIFLQANKLDIAKWIFAEKVLRIDPNSVEALTNLGVVWIRLDDLPSAVALLKRAIKLDPSNIAARMNLGSIFIDYLNYPGAQEHYEHVLQVQPNNVEAVIGLATAKLARHNFKAAVEGYLHAYKLDSRRHELLLRTAKLYEDKFSTNEEGMKVAIGYYEQYATAAQLPPAHKVLKTIVVLKEMIEKGMLRELPEETPGAEEGDAAPAEEAPAEEAPAEEEETTSKPADKSETTTEPKPKTEPEPKAEPEPEPEPEPETPAEK
jgi:tetratricopeptide (TPR) repeat protein